MKKHYKMYLLSLALLLCEMVNGCQYDNFRKTVPDRVWVPEKMVKVLKPLLTIPNPGKPEEQGTCAILSSEEAQQYYIDGVGFRKVEREEVKEGFSGMKQVNEMPIGRSFDSLYECIADRKTHVQDPKNGFKIGAVICCALFPTKQVKSFRISRVQQCNSDPNNYNRILMNRTLLYADTRDTKLKAIDESIIRRRFRGSQTLFRQAVPLAIQDVLVIILTNAGPEHQIFRIYEGGGIKFVEDFPTNFPNCHWNTKSNTPAKLPSSSLSEGWPT